MSKTIKASWNSSDQEKKIRKDFLKLFKNTPIPDDELLRNLYLFIKRQDLSDILFFNHLYNEILDVHGSIMEFGVRWGRNLGLLSALRGIHEPFNHTRQIIGFDTFEGLASLDKKDGRHEIAKKGALNVSENYEEYLEKILKYHDDESPIPHIRKFKIIKGDTTKTLKKFLDDNPQTMISMAYFDMDIYKPTKFCLENIKPRLSKGSIVGFDELASEKFPGETLALIDTLGLQNYKVNRSHYSGFKSYIKI